jgi:hypothetical protein
MVKIQQIIPAQPGWQAVLIDQDDDLEFRDLVGWALMEDNRGGVAILPMYTGPNGSLPILATTNGLVGIKTPTDPPHRISEMVEAYREQRRTEQFKI